MVAEKPPQARSAMGSHFPRDGIRHHAGDERAIAETGIVEPGLKRVWFPTLLRLDHRAEEVPDLAVKLRELHLADREELLRCGADLDARQQHRQVHVEI